MSELDWMDKLGGQAFPSTADVGEGATLSFPGMSLRDYFAAKAMQAIIAEVAKAARKAGEPNGFALTATLAFSAADAMLVARK